MNESLAYLNGSWIPNQQLSIPIDDLGFTMGVTITERLRTFRGQIFRKEDHLKRLKDSLKTVGWNAHSICEEVADAIDKWAAKNNSCIIPGDDWNVISFVTPGKTHSAENPHVCVHGAPIPFQTYAHLYDTGAQAIFVETRQVPSNCWPIETKCRSRLHYYLADREAHAVDRSARAILLDQEGFVGEGSTANIVAYFADRGLVTPYRFKVLPGVSQQILFELAHSLKIPHCEADIRPEELLRAEEVFFTSTSICLLSVSKIGSKTIGMGRPGPIFERLIAAWSEMTGINIKNQALEFTERS